MYKIYKVLILHKHSVSAHDTQYIQFKTCIIELFGDPLDNIDNIEDYVPFELPDNVAKSQIVEEFHAEMRAKIVDIEDQYKIFIEAVLKIYRKYIAINRAKYEINISYKTRKKFEMIFNPRSTTGGRYNLNQIYKNILNRNPNEYNELDGKIIILSDDLDVGLLKAITILLPLLHECVQQTQNLMLDAFFRFQHTNYARELYRTMTDVDVQ